ncbi:MAG: hypothetical protein U1F25_20030 [Rubrivivax sp.]
MNWRHLAAAFTLAACTALASAQDLVVYHIDDAAQQALKGLRNICNHLDTDPSARITVVTHARRGLPDGRREGRERQPTPAPWRRRWRAASSSRCARSRRAGPGGLKKEQFLAGGRVHALGRGALGEATEAGRRVHQALSDGAAAVEGANEDADEDAPGFALLAPLALTVAAPAGFASDAARAQEIVSGKCFVRYGADGESLEPDVPAPGRPALGLHRAPARRLQERPPQELDDAADGR